jgi:hypothetical protein
MLSLHINAVKQDFSLTANYAKARETGNYKSNPNPSTLKQAGSLHHNS